MLRLTSSSGMAATRWNTGLFLNSVSSSPPAPSFRALSRLFCSSEGKHGSSMAVIDSAECSVTASIHSKVQDEKIPEWSLYESVWCGPRKCRLVPNIASYFRVTCVLGLDRGWQIARQFEEVKNKYQKIPVEKVDFSMFMKGRQPEPIKFLGVLNFNVYSVIVKADFKGQEVMKRTMLVTGRDVKQLEAAVERLNKFRSLSTLLKDLIWNR